MLTSLTVARDAASAHKRFPTSPNAGDKEYVGISIILATVLMGFWGVRSWAKSLQ